MSGNRRRERSPSEIENWEKDLIVWAARKAEPRDRQELMAELARALFALKIESRAAIGNWRGYVRQFLRNKALNWIRNQRRRQAASLDQTLGDETGNFTLADVLNAGEPDHDQRIALAAAFEALGPDLQAVWRTFIEAEGNQSEVSRRLHVHRNTVGAWIRKIRTVLIAHGLVPAPAGDQKSIAAPRRKIRRIRPASRRFVVIPSRFLRTLAQRRLSGIQWRMLLWVRREITRRHQKNVSASWYKLARELRVDRSAVRRAGRRLLEFHLLFLDGGEIGVSPKP